MFYIFYMFLYYIINIDLKMRLLTKLAILTLLASEETEATKLVQKNFGDL